LQARLLVEQAFQRVARFRVVRLRNVTDDVAIRTGWTSGRPSQGFLLRLQDGPIIAGIEKGI
jgi:hypothetical protein